MKILCVCQYFWPESFRVTDVCLGLKELGHEVTVLTGIPNYPEGKFYRGYGLFHNKEEDFQGIRVIRSWLIPRMQGKGWQLGLNYLSFAVSSRIKAHLLRPADFDLIFVYQLSPVTMAAPALVLKKKTGVPVLLYLLDLWPESVKAASSLKLAPVLKWLDKISSSIYKSCDRILVTSRGFINRLTERGIEGSRLFYWPQWAEDLYQIVELEEEAEERRQIPSGFVVMFAGNIGAAQGFEMIVEAAERLKQYRDIHWIILGDGRMKPWVESEVEARGLKHCFHLLGRHPVEKMPRYFALADALLVSLMKDPMLTLTLPAKVQSYMACGKPILAAVDGEGASVVKEAQAGLTCSSDDPDGLSRIVLQLYKMDSEKRKEMGLRGKEYFELHFKRDELLKELEANMFEVIRYHTVSLSREGLK